MRRFLSITFLALLTVLLASGLAPAQTLQETARLMLDFEPEIQAAGQETLSAEEDWRIARAELLPHLTADALSGPSARDRSTDGLVQSTGDTLFNRQFGVSLRQLLYDGGLARHQTRSAMYSWKAQEYVERSTIESRVVDLAEVYLEVLRTRRQLVNAEENVETHGEMRDMLRVKAALNGNRADLALVEGRLSLAVTTLETQRLANELAASRFERLVGQRPSNLIAPEIPALPRKPENLDLNGNWEYLAAAEALDAAIEREKSMRGNRLPKVYLDVGASRGRDVLGVEGDDDEMRALVVGSWDLYRGGGNKALERRERLQVGKFTELLRAADIQRRYTRTVLWQEREGSVASIKSLTVYVDELQNVTSDYKEQFKVGRQDLLNILDVQSEYYRAKTRLLNAHFDANTSAFRMMGVQGRLTVYLIGREAFARRARRGGADEETAEYDRLRAALSTRSAGGKTTGEEPGVIVRSPRDDAAKAEPKTGFFKNLFGQKQPESSNSGEPVQKGPFEKLFGRDR